MPSYSVEVPPELIVHWLIGALAAGPLKNAMRATREYVAKDDFDLDRAGLSGSDDIDAVVAIGILEVEAAPPAGPARFFGAAVPRRAFHGLRRSRSHRRRRSIAAMVGPMT